MSTAVSTLESLRETLQQTLEEKERIEQKYLEDCQRIEQTLAEIKSTISAYTAELQSLGYTALTVLPDAASESPKRPQSTAPVLTAEDVRRIMQERVSAQNDSFSFKIGNKGKIVLYVIGTILMFLLLLFLASLFDKPKQTGQVLPASRPVAIQFPSLMSSAEACTIADRIRERMQEQRGTVDSPPVATEESDADEGECAETDGCTAEVKAPQEHSPRRPLRILFRSMLRR